MSTTITGVTTQTQTPAPGPAKTDAKPASVPVETATIGADPGWKPFKPVSIPADFNPMDNQSEWSAKPHDTPEYRTAMGAIMSNNVQETFDPLGDFVVGATADHVAGTTPDAGWENAKWQISPDGTHIHFEGVDGLQCGVYGKNSLVSGDVEIDPKSQDVKAAHYEVDRQAHADDPSYITPYHMSGDVAHNGDGSSAFTVAYSDPKGLQKTEHVDSHADGTAVYDGWQVQSGGPKQSTIT